MKKSYLQSLLTDPKRMFLLIISVVAIFLLVFFLSRGRRGAEAPIKEGQIKIVKGDEVITVNENGLVEYKSKDKVYTEMWDASQISSFFSMMESKARDYLNRRVSGGDCGYKVFMFLDGRLVTVCLDSHDSDMGDTVEPIFIMNSGVDLSDYFGDGSEEDNEEEFSGEVPFPTTTSFPQVSPSPTPYTLYNPYTNYPPVKADCETWSGSIVNNRAIISNTYCTVNSTPTPTP